MDFFEATIVSSVVTLFPILLYFIYLIYNYDFNKKASDVILDICLITSFYLTYKIGHSDISYFLIFIPLLIAYLKKRIPALIFIFLLTITCNNIYLVIAELILFILSKILRREKLFVLISLLMVSILVLINIDSFSGSFILKLIIELLIGIILTIFVLKAFNQFNQLINIFTNLNEIKKETKIQESLFKITHEIKNPIAVCKGYLDMYKIDNIEHSRKYIPIIKEEIERTLTLLKDFLSLRKISLDKEEMDLCLLFDETISEMSLYDIKYIKKYKDEIYIEADYNRLKQVLINIFKNSIESGASIIKVEIIDDMIKISDNGSGMDFETLNRIKEPFYTTKKSGTGLGVPLSIEIIEAHGWNINYESKMNVGTNVIIKM